MSDHIENSARLVGKSSWVKRGAFLSIMFIYFIFVYLSRLISILFAKLPAFQEVVYAGEPSWGIWINIIVFVVGSAGLILLFNWKKLGLYLVLCGLVIGLGSDFILVPGQLKNLAWYHYLFSLVPYLLLIWAVTRKSADFKH